MSELKRQRRQNKESSRNRARPLSISSILDGRGCLTNTPGDFSSRVQVIIECIQATVILASSNERVEEEQETRSETSLPILSPLSSPLASSKKRSDLSYNMSLISYVQSCV
jgi:hypothetical protein